MLTKDFDTKITRISKTLILKTIVTFILIIAELSNVIKVAINDHINNTTTQLVYYVTPALLVITYSLALFFMHYERKRGLRVGALLFIFWSLLLVVYLIVLRSKVLRSWNKPEDNDRSYALYITIFKMVLIFLNCVLSTLAENATDRRTESEKLKNMSELPHERTSLLSMLTFWWITGLIKKGHKKDLKEEDFWIIDERERSKFISNKLGDCWNKRAQWYIKENVKYLQSKEISFINKSSTGGETTTKDGEQREEEKEVFITNNLNSKDKHSKPPKQPSLIWCISKVSTF
jgi:hypothetical protein